MTVDDSQLLGEGIILLTTLYENIEAPLHVATLTVQKELPASRVSVV